MILVDSDFYAVHQLVVDCLLPFFGSRPGFRLQHLLMRPRRFSVLYLVPTPHMLVANMLLHL